MVTLLKLFKRKVCYDPLLSKEEIDGFGVKTFDNLNAKMEGVIVAVAHDEFKKSPFLAQVLSLERKCIDVRGIFKEEDARQKGFYYMRLRRQKDINA